MKRSNMFFRAIVLLFGMLSLTACNVVTVPPGNVGIKFNKWGGSKGIQQTTVGSGQYFLGMGEDIFTYPTYTSTIAYCRDVVEATETTTEIMFQSKDNAVVFGCIGMNYKADESKVPLLFQKFRAAGVSDRSPLDVVAKTWLRQQIANGLNQNAGGSTAFELNSSREAILQKVFADVSVKAAEFGIVVEQLSWLGPLHYPDQVQKSINNTLEAIQEAERAHQQLATAEANAKITVANANASAEAVRVQAAAIAANPEFLKQMWIAKWNGQLPNTWASDGTPVYVGVGK